MISEAVAKSVKEPPVAAAALRRARVGALTARLEALRVELAGAEQALAVLESGADAARARLEVRLAHVVEHHRRALDDDHRRVRAEAVVAIAAAHVEADRAARRLLAPVADAPDGERPTLTVDAETMATVIAAALERHRVAARPSRPAPAPAARRGSFASALHADVLLSIAAMALVVVVLLAWSA